MIELAQQRYPPGKVHGFDENIHAAHNVIITNGTLGLNAHHSIHGNDNRNIHIHDLKIMNFEIAAICINNGKNIVIEDVEIDNEDMEVEVHSNYAIAKMLESTLRHIIDDPNRDFTNEDEAQARRYLDDPNFRNLLVNPGRDLFTGNPSLKTEGNSFGIYLASDFNVGDLGVGDLKKRTMNVVVRNVMVKYISSGEYEKTSMMIHGHPLFDALGNRMQWGYLFDDDGQRLRLNDQLNKIKFDIIQRQVWSANLINRAHRAHHQLEPNFVTAVMQNLQHDAKSLGIHPLSGVDSREGHSPKGTFGMRFDGVQNLRVQNCRIKRIKNGDVRGSGLRDNKAQYPTTPIVWGGKEGTKFIYKGNYAYGISLSSCLNVDLYDIHIDDVESKNGNAFGIAFLGPTRAVTVSRVEVDDIEVDGDYNSNPPSLPNVKTKGMTWFREETAQDIVFFEVTMAAMHEAPITPCRGDNRDSPICPLPGTDWSMDEPGCGTAAWLNILLITFGVCAAIGCVAGCVIMWVQRDWDKTNKIQDANKAYDEKQRQKDVETHGSRRIDASGRSHASGRQRKRRT